MKRLTTHDYLTGVAPDVLRRLAAEVGTLDDPGASTALADIHDAIDLAQRRKHAGRGLQAAANILGLKLCPAMQARQRERLERRRKHRNVIGETMKAECDGVKRKALAKASVE